MCAIGLSLIYGTTQFTNFAHGEAVTFGALATWYLNVDVGVPLAASAGTAAVAPMPTRRPLEATAAARAARRRSAVDSGAGGTSGTGDLLQARRAVGRTRIVLELYSGGADGAPVRARAAPGGLKRCSPPRSACSARTGSFR